LAGCANISAYFPSGWLAVAPDAFSYGPQILQILPNVGGKAGGDAVEIRGYGFGSDASTTSVYVGGANAVIQKLENVLSLALELGLATSFPFPLERITVQSAPGNSGSAAVTVTSNEVGRALGAKVIRPPVLNHLLDRFAISDFVVENFTREVWKFRITRKAQRDDLSDGEFSNTRLQFRGQKAHVTKLLLEANHAVLNR
jgi:hypothetical protein